MKWLFALCLIFNITRGFSEESAQSDELLSESNFKADFPSAANRQSLRYQFAFGFLGTEYIGSNTLTLSAGYYLSPNDLIVLRQSVFNGEHNDKAAMKLRATTLGYRHFIGNSFNFMASVYHKRNTTDYYQEGAFVSIGHPNLIYEDVGLGFKLGNEWQWKHFTIGCDWFGINRTVLKIHQQENAIGSIRDISLQKQLTLTVLSFYLGYSF